jgi:hypothetical protein
MLFLQGTRDALADAGLIRRALEPLADRARLIPIEAADHAFHVPARSGRSDGDVIREIAEALATWTRAIAG